MKNENVICVPVSAMRGVFDLDKEYWEVSREDINRLTFEYRPRAEAEYDSCYKQLIPYAVLFNGTGEVLTYRRCGSEKRLSDMSSVGIGGHVNDGDSGACLYDIMVSGLKREFREEVGVSLSESQIRLLGMINEEHTEVGQCHSGIVFRVDMDSRGLNFDPEIGNPEWIPLDKINLSKFELWSSLALKLCKDERNTTEI